MNAWCRYNQFTIYVCHITHKHYQYTNISICISVSQYTDTSTYHCSNIRIQEYSSISIHPQINIWICPWSIGIGSTCHLTSIFKSTFLRSTGFVWHLTSTYQHTSISTCQYIDTTTPHYINVRIQWYSNVSIQQHLNISICPWSIVIGCLCHLRSIHRYTNMSVYQHINTVTYQYISMQIQLAIYQHITISMYLWSIGCVCHHNNMKIPKYRYSYINVSLQQHIKISRYE